MPIISLYAIIKKSYNRWHNKNYIQTQPHTNINQHHIKDEKWTNYFNTLNLREKLDQLGRCRFMDRSEFADGCN